MSAVSTPQMLISPPLKIASWNPVEGASERSRITSLTVLLKYVISSVARSSKSVASTPPSISVWRSGRRSVAAVAPWTRSAGSPPMFRPSYSVNFCP